MAKVTTDNRYSDGFVYAILVCLGLAAAVGLLGNMLLVIVITQARKLRSVMNRFILHLAVGDLIVCTICIPLFLAINFYPSKSSQAWICKLGRFLQYLAPQGSMMLLITIGLNRHQAIVHPLKGMTYQTANKLIIAAWLYAVLVVAPSLYLTQVQFYINPNTNTTEPYCSTIPVTSKLGKSYVLALAFLGYVMPLTALLILYAKISCAVWKRNTQTSELRTSRPAAAMLRSRKKVIKMFLTVILVFVVTWLPLIIYVGVLEPYFGGAQRISNVRLTLYAIGLSNSIYNPFIYSFFNSRFREGCKSLFKRSIPVMKRRTAEKERSGKLEPGILRKEASEQAKDWINLYSSKAARQQRKENTFHDVRDDIKLIQLNFNALHKEPESPGKPEDSECYGCTKHTTKQDTEQASWNITNSANTGQLFQTDSRQNLFKKTLFKTLSFDETTSAHQHKNTKRRKTLSDVSDTLWNNDFENIF